MIVVSHRPPLKRVDLAARPQAPAVVEQPECPYARAQRLTHEFRVWNAIQAAAKASQQGEKSNDHGTTDDT